MQLVSAFGGWFGWPGLVYNAILLNEIAPNWNAEMPPIVFGPNVSLRFFLHLHGWWYFMVLAGFISPIPIKAN